MKKTKDDGITLIALVITIIILLILAGLSISALTGSGLFTKAQWAVKLTKIREIEEAANLAYLTRQVDEFTKGEAATVAGVISDLKAQGYNIEQRTSGSNTVTGIELNKTNVKMNKNSQETLTYTLVYGEGTVRYFAEIDGKYYEMIFENGVFKINIDETDLEGINRETKVTATSNDESISTAQKTEGKDEILINSLNEHGETTITIKEENSGIATVCNVKVMTLIESITFKQETIIIEKGNNVELNALVTINPADTTETLIWTTENGEIVEITEEGRLVGVKEGTTTIKVTNEDGTIEATCTVKVVISATGITLNKSLIEMNKNSTDNTLKATLNPADTTEPIVWSTGDSSKVTVIADSSDTTGKTAKISAVGAGTTTVTATCSGQTASCTIIVKVPAIGLTINPNSQSIFVGDTVKLVANPIPEDTTDKITWSSSNESIATVSQDGTVTGKAKGVATITVTCGNKTASCAITVSNFSSTVTGSDYGKTVTNYKAGQEWQIFYADDENIYLISKNNVNDPVHNSNNWSKGIDTGNYRSGTTMLSESTRFPSVKKWLSKYISYINSNSVSGYASYGVQGMLFLLDSTNVWNGIYKNNYSDYAIGGPTAEMLVASLNVGRISDIVSCSVIDKMGYRINGNTTNVNLKLNSNDFRYGEYYLASADHTVLYSYADQVLWYFSSGYCQRSEYNSNANGIAYYRPVVCLKSNIKLIPDTYNSDKTVATYKIAQ